MAPQPYSRSTITLITLYLGTKYYFRETLLLIPHSYERDVPTQARSMYNVVCGRHPHNSRLVSITAELGNCLPSSDFYSIFLTTSSFLEGSFVILSSSIFFSLSSFDLNAFRIKEAREFHFPLFIFFSYDLDAFGRGTEVYSAFPCFNSLLFSTWTPSGERGMRILPSSYFHSFLTIWTFSG